MCLTFIILACLVSICFILSIYLGFKGNRDFFILSVIIFFISLFIFLPIASTDTCKNSEEVINQKYIESVYSNNFATIKITSNGDEFLNFSKASEINKIKSGLFDVVKQVQYNHYGQIIRITYKIKEN